MKNTGSQRVRKNNKGFTLIELLVVMVILGLLAALVGPRLFGHVGKSQAQAAKLQIGMIEEALDAFRLDIGRYPSSQEGLSALVANPGIEGWDGPYLKKTTPNDPWKRPYQYQAPGAHGDYDLFSYGADGAPGGDGDNKDINSWE